LDGGCTTVGIAELELAIGRVVPPQPLFARAVVIVNGGVVTVDLAGFDGSGEGLVGEGVGCGETNEGVGGGRERQNCGS
jgi:hypothetical protein